MTHSQLGRRKMTRGDLNELSRYHLCIIEISVKLINFGLFIDGTLHREGKSTASLSVATDEAFTAHIYLSCRDQGDGNAILYPSGKITTSGSGNLNVVPLTGVGAFNTPIPINVAHTIDLKTIWTSSDGDSITGDYATLMRCG